MRCRLMPPLVFVIARGDCMCFDAHCSSANLLACLLFPCAHRQAHRANRVPPPGRPRERAAAGRSRGPACSCGREAGRTLAGVTGQQAAIKTPPHALNLPVRRAQQCTLAACHGVCPALSSFCDSAKPSGPATCSLPSGPAQCTGAAMIQLIAMFRSRAGTLLAPGSMLAYP